MTHPLNHTDQWVGSPVDHRTGESAKEALASTNDARYWTDNGIIEVDQERWEQAQKYERSTWMQHGLAAKDDRDHEHKAGFKYYSCLPKTLGNVVEFGCGPFTQTINITNLCSAESITLVDPLLLEYREHPNCRYRYLYPKPVVFKNMPAEDFTGKGYDAAVCINVLEHVRNAATVMDNIVGCLREGGWLIFHERVYDDLDINMIYDVGHPIRVTGQFLEPYLKQFTVQFQNNDYFIGTKCKSN